MYQFLKQKIYVSLLLLALLIMFLISLIFVLIFFLGNKLKQNIKNVIIQKIPIESLIFALLIMLSVMFILSNTNDFYMMQLTSLENLFLSSKSDIELLKASVYTVAPSIIIGLFVWMSSSKGTIEFDRLISPFFPIIFLMVFYAATPIIFIDLPKTMYDKALPLYDGNTTLLINSIDKDFATINKKRKDDIEKFFEQKILQVEKKERDAQFPANYAFHYTKEFLEHSKKKIVDYYNKKIKISSTLLNSTLQDARNENRKALYDSIYKNKFISNTQVILDKPFEFFGKIILTLFVIIISIFAIVLIKTFKEEKKDKKSQNTLLMMGIYSSYGYLFIMSLPPPYPDSIYWMGAWMFVLGLLSLLVVLTIQKEERTSIFNVIVSQTLIFSILLFLFHSLIPQAIKTIVLQYS